MDLLKKDLIEFLKRVQLETDNTQTHHDATKLLKSLNSIESCGSSETQAVRQNKQTQEVCPICNGAKVIEDGIIEIQCKNC